MKNILKILLLFNPFQANTSFLSPLFSWSIERKHRPKIDQYIQEEIIISYGLFVGFEINLIFDTSREAGFGKTLKFCWGLKGGMSYEILSFTDTSSTENFLKFFWLVNRFEMLILLIFFLLLVCWPTLPVSFDFFCFGIS